MRSLFFIACFLLTSVVLNAEDGYRLWLKYDLVDNTKRLKEYQQNITGWIVTGNSPTANATRQELQRGLNGLLGKTFVELKQNAPGTILAISLAQASSFPGLNLAEKLKNVSPEGFIIF